MRFHNDCYFLSTQKYGGSVHDSGILTTVNCRFARECFEGFERRSCSRIRDTNVDERVKGPLVRIQSRHTVSTFIHRYSVATVCDSDRGRPSSQTCVTMQSRSSRRITCPFHWLLPSSALTIDRVLVPAERACRFRGVKTISANDPIDQAPNDP